MSQWPFLGQEEVDSGPVEMERPLREGEELIVIHETLKS